tara:strand:+ start:380 stop:841 length:462 start_codon:yes stop_codon:yes gene_type:complete
LYHKAWRAARKYGYRSGLEHTISEKLKENKVKFTYESIKIEWQDLAYRTYTPDFILDNGVIVEVKGRFMTADRRKHLEIKKQYPELDIRFVFENSRNKLSKGRKTTYADWCIKNGFRYYDRIIPEDWINEKGKNKHPSFIAHPSSTVKRRKAK